MATKYTPEQIQHAATYVAWVKRCRQAFADGYKRVSYAWPHTNGITEAEFNQKLWDALNARINERGSLLLPDLEMKETAWMRDKIRLASIRSRIRVYQFESKECRKRFGHLLSRYDD